MKDIRMKALSLMLAVCMAFTLLPVSASAEESGTDKIQVSSVKLTASKNEVEVDEEVTLTATVSGNNLPAVSGNSVSGNAISELTWKSSDESILQLSAEAATVDQKGSVYTVTKKATAKAEGSSTVTVQIGDKTDQCTVKVNAKSPVKVTGVTVAPEAVSLKVEETKKLDVTVTPEDAADKTVTWSSNNEKIATVDENGTVTAVAVGKATITATAADGSGVSGTCEVTVDPTLVTSLRISPSYVVLDDLNETATLRTKVQPGNATDSSVTWTSSDEKIATVDENGTVTAVAVGNAKITATAADGSGKYATCTVIVRTVIDSVTIDEAVTLTKVNEKKTINVIAVSPDKASNKELTWSSSDTSVATVDANGTVTAKKFGEAIITARAANNDGVFATCKVTVKEVKVTGLTISNKTASLVVNGAKNKQTVTLKINKVTPSNASNTGVNWSSSNTKVASVNAKGVVTAKGPGTATITATAKDGSGKKVTCKVTVTKLATSVKLNATSASLVAGKTQTLKATVSSDASNKKVTWKSSNTKVATVDSKGKVTAKAAGTATITVTTADGSKKTATCKVTVYAKTGTTATVGAAKVKVVGTGAVAYVGPKSASATSATIPATVKISGVTYKVTQIANNAFKNNKKVKTVTIGNNVTSIGANAFAGCTSLTTVKIGSGVTKIDTNAFSGCSKLKTITISSTKLKTVGKNAFKGINKSAKIKVPSSRVSTYTKMLKGKGQPSSVKVTK